MLIGEQVVGFRDSAYLYYPLFKWIDAQWAAGVVPLWNPYCNFGMPVVHDGSSSVYYPGKLIFFLRALPYPARYGIYIAVHVPLAAAGTFWLARTLKASQVAATLAAFAFAFSGAVLFQTTNVVYLVSAAWLPFALCSVWLMFRHWRVKWAIWTAIFCSMMILGGDPQMCYHVGLIMCAFAVWKWWRARRRYFGCLRDLKVRGSQRRVVLKSLALIGTVVGVTFLLSAVQVLPSYVWSQGSIRAPIQRVRTVPRSVAEVYANRTNVNEKQIRDGLFGVPQLGTHHDHVYQFSQPPWTISELIWGNVSGRAYPVNQRWVDALPGAERMWTPSIYAGCVVFLLALVAFNPFSRNRKLAWLSRLALFFAIASFGWYGPVWLVSEISPRWMARQNLGPPVGGLYWCMVVLLPKYVAFRYPAKLMTIAVLAICVLAGLSLDRCLRKRKFSLLFSLGGIVCGASGLLFLFGRRIATIGESASSELFGPFDWSGCAEGLCVSAVTTTLALVICGVVLKVAKRSPSFSACCVLVVVMLDVLFANSYLVPVISRDSFESETRWANWGKSNPGSVVYRDSELAFPGGWSTDGSKNRLSEIVRWQRESLHPKHHLEDEITLIGSFYSLEPRVKPHEYNSPLNDSYRLVQDNQGEFSLVKTTGGTAPVTIWSVQSRCSLVWESCNEMRILANMSAWPGATEPAPGTDRRFSFALQPLRGWKFSAVDQETKRSLEVSVLPDDPHVFLLEPCDRVEITGKFEPIEFYVGAWLTASSWVALLLVSVGLTWTRRRQLLRNLCRL